MLDSYPAEGVSLSDTKYRPLPDQSSVPGAPQVPGAVAVTMEHTTVTITREQPKDHIVWSVIGLFFANILCLALAAFICSVKSRDRKMVGDLVGAQRHGSTAFSLNVANTVLAAVLLLLVIGLCFYNPMMLGALSGLWLRLI